MSKGKQNGKDRAMREDVAAGANGRRTANASAELPDGDVLMIANDRRGRGMVINEEALSDDFVPATPLHRDREMRRIAECVESDTPNHMWVCGKPGAGKTLAIRHVLKHTTANAGEPHVEIDCWEMDTYHRVLDEIARQLDRASAKRTPLEDKVRGFGKQEVEAYLDGHRFVVVLDQIDQPSPKERNAILYNLTQLGHVRIICVTSDAEPLMDIDARVQSRLNAVVMKFRPYSPDQLMDILKQRALQGLREGTWTDATISDIAQLVQGDARLAIRLLRDAAQLAAHEGTTRIESEHVKTVAKSVWRNGPAQKLAKLSNHHRLLYKLTPRKDTIASDHLRRAYVSSCQAHQIEPIAQRTYTKYLRAMINAKLLHEMPAPGKGNLRLLRRRLAGWSHTIDAGP